MDERLIRAKQLESEAQRLLDDYKANPPVVSKIAYLIDESPGVYLVGYRDEPQIGDYPYNGPCARISSDGSWVYVNTDDYEGNAMINIEALPKLIEALTKLEDHLNTAPVATNPRQAANVLDMKIKRKG